MMRETAPPGENATFMPGVHSALTTRPTLIVVDPVPLDWLSASPVLRVVVQGPCPVT
jgi:hypothetical protein